MTLAPRPSDAELLERARLGQYHAEQRARGLRNAAAAPRVGSVALGPNAIVSAIAGEKRKGSSHKGERLNDPEAQEQRALFARIDALPDSSPYAALRECYAVPNGGKRGPLTAKKMKAEGVRRGELDINLDIARGGFFGLRLEMKAEGGSLSVDQCARMEEHRLNGYANEVAYGAEEAWRILVRYISLPPTLVMPRP